MSSWTPEDAYQFLLNLPRYAVAGDAAYKPGLERIETLLAEVDNPHVTYPSIHVAGSNGKGSVASMTAAILGASGLKVGLHTSPHFCGLEERMRIGPEPPPREWVASTTARVRGSIERLGASFFEATVLLSLLYFADQAVDVAVVEVGLGGRLDATNVLQPEVSVITEISLEHTDILGTTISRIAGEKAGIIKPGVPALTIAGGEALDVLRSRASALRAPFEYVRSTCSISSARFRLSGTTLNVTTPNDVYDDLELSLAGRHQVWNAALALRAADTFARRTE
ncbi:MAG: Mur ligase family protein, partial [Rhodothermales bacterium]|nr:Mur ligase family protein [Rhodothermales bacterium]